MSNHSYRPPPPITGRLYRSDAIFDTTQFDFDETLTWSPDRGRSPSPGGSEYDSSDGYPSLYDTPNSQSLTSDRVGRSRAPQRTFDTRQLRSPSPPPEDDWNPSGWTTTTRPVPIGPPQSVYTGDAGLFSPPQRPYRGPRHTPRWNPPTADESPFGYDELLTSMSDMGLNQSRLTGSLGEGQMMLRRGDRAPSRSLSFSREDRPPPMERSVRVRPPSIADPSALLQNSTSQTSAYLTALDRGPMTSPLPLPRSPLGRGLPLPYPNASSASGRRMSIQDTSRW